MIRIGDNHLPKVGTEPIVRRFGDKDAVAQKLRVTSVYVRHEKVNERSELTVSRVLSEEDLQFVSRD